MDAPTDERPSRPGDVAVTVTRTGGIAGIRREWHTEPPAEEAPRWIALIEGCPWDAVVAASGRGGDRFVWRIHARCGPEERGAELPDSEMLGPWRDLVDEVREADREPVSRANEPDATRRPRTRRPR